MSDTRAPRRRPNPLRRPLLALLLVAFVLPLAGCFDLVEEMNIGGEGGGRLSTALFFDHSVSMADATAFDPLLGGPGYRRQTLEKDGAPVVAEMVQFESFEEFLISGGSYKLRTDPEGARLVERVWRRDTDLTREQIEHMKLVLTGHQYVLTLNFPAPFRRAHPVQVLERTFYPDVSERTVRWIVPMPELVEHITRGELVFQVEV